MRRFRQSWAKVKTISYQYFFGWKLCIFALVYLNLWGLFGDQALPPHGNYFHMFMIFIAAHICGKISFVCNLPPLFGMLIAGFVYGNVLDVNLDKQMTSLARSISLMIILLRAGLNLDPSQIKKLSFVCFRLAFIPCIVESLTIAFCSHFLFDLNISWSLMLGFVISAVSPAVVVPGIIKVQEQKLSVSKGVPTLIIAAASIDDVLAISGFSVCLSFAFSKASDESNEAWKIAKSILKGPFEAAVGLAYGALIGIMLWYLPQKSELNRKNETKNYDLHRFVMMLLAGLFATFGSKVFDLAGAAPLAILVLSFVASLRWRPCGFDVYNEDNLKRLWLIFQHFLFCLIGADVRLKTMQSDVLLYALICLLAGIVMRTIVAFLVTYGTALNWKERLFTAIAWLPKATVQAAIGSIALDNAVTPEEVKNGRHILTIAVLSILLTAPIGAIAIDYFSKILLTPDDNGSLTSECQDNQSMDSVQIQTLQIETNRELIR